MSLLFLKRFKFDIDPQKVELYNNFSFQNEALETARIDKSLNISSNLSVCLEW